MENKVIVVTGASGRLGRILVQRFAERGASIAAVVRSEEDARSLPFPEDREGWAYPVDVTREDHVRACFDQILDAFGRVDALVHAVGMWEARPFLETPLDAWERVMKTNLTSTFLCVREAVRVMDGRGTIVTFSSAHGADRGVGEQAAYAAAKAGVIRLVEALADEHPHIRAHAVAPSTILHDGEGEGVTADELAALVGALITDIGGAVKGSVIRAYGS